MTSEEKTSSPASFSSYKSSYWSSRRLSETPGPNSSPSLSEKQHDFASIETQENELLVYTEVFYNSECFHIKTISRLRYSKYITAGAISRPASLIVSQATGLSAIGIKGTKRLVRLIPHQLRK